MDMSTLLSKLHGHGAIVTSTVLFVAVTALACKFHVTAQLRDGRENTTRPNIPKKNERRHRQSKKKTQLQVNDSGLPTDVFPSHLQREMYKEERREVMRPLITMKRPMYDNIMMMSQQGSNLSTISLKKAKWYVQKGLATWVTTAGTQEENNSYCNDAADTTSTGPSKIQLLFEHSAAETKDASLQTYNASVKQNCCVVCGSDRDYMRHYIVPYCYRTHFPDHYKTHMPHDVVLLCLPCHAEAEGRTHRRMQQLEHTLRCSPYAGTRLHPTSAQAELVDKHIYNVRSAATALLQWKDKLPVAKILAYESRVRDWYVSHCSSTAASLSSGPLIDLTETILIEASQLESRRPNPDYVPGADLVIASLQMSNDNGRRDLCKKALARFIREWRQHFLDGLYPRHLPDGWGVETAVHCDRRNGDD